MIIHSGYLLLHLCNQFIAFLGVELQDASHLDLHQFQDIIAGHLPHQSWLKGFQTMIDMSHCLIHILGILKLGILIDPLFDEDLFE